MGQDEAMHPNRWSKGEERVWKERKIDFRGKGTNNKKKKNHGAESAKLYTRIMMIFIFIYMPCRCMIALVLAKSTGEGLCHII